MNTKYIAKEKVAPAVFFSFFTVLISMLVLYNIVTQLGPESGILAIVVYSCGIATGTYIAMKTPSLRQKQ